MSAKEVVEKELQQAVGILTSHQGNVKTLEFLEPTVTWDELERNKVKGVLGAAVASKCEFEKLPYILGLMMFADALTAAGAHDIEQVVKYVKVHLRVELAAFSQDLNKRITAARVAQKSGGEDGAAAPSPSPSPSSSAPSSKKRLKTRKAGGSD